MFITMDAVDKLLAELKAAQEQQATSGQPESLAPPQIRPVPSASPSGPSLAANSVDDLLSQIAADTPRSPAPAPAPSPVQRDQGAKTAEDSLLADLKAQYTEHDRATALQQQQAQQQAERQRQQQAREKQKRLEHLRQQRRAELTKQAEAWLKQINPRSEEGLWFEEFACGYATRLEAAIDYLEALQEVKE